MNSLVRGPKVLRKKKAELRSWVVVRFKSKVERRSSTVLSAKGRERGGKKKGERKKNKKLGKKKGKKDEEGERERERERARKALRVRK